MLQQLLHLVEEHLQGIDRNVPELRDLDSKSISSMTSQTVVNTIMQQAKKGNTFALREMLSGVDTDASHDVIKQLQGPVTTQLQNKLNISSEGAGHLATMALPIILNMLNSKVKTAQHQGINIQDALEALNGKGGGILQSITGLLGGNNKSNKTINSILQNLIG